MSISNSDTLKILDYMWKYSDQNLNKAPIEQPSPIAQGQALALKIAPLLSCGWDTYFLTHIDGLTYRFGSLSEWDDRNKARKECQSYRTRIDDWTNCIACCDYEPHISGSVYIFDRRARYTIGEALHSLYVTKERANKLNAAGGYEHFVALNEEGTVKARGKNSKGQLYCDGWVNVKQVDCGCYHTVALRNDGTVIACGDNNVGQCNVRGWTDIVFIACGNYHTVGLKSDGTVVTCGSNDYGKCNTYDWTDIITIAAGVNHTLGIKVDGTVVGVGNGDHGQLDVNDWKNMIAIGAGDKFSVGITRDGKVVKCGKRLGWISNTLGNSEDYIFSNIRFFKNAETREKEHQEYLREKERGRQATSNPAPTVSTPVTSAPAASTPVSKPAPTPVSSTPASPPAAAPVQNMTTMSGAELYKVAMDNQFNREIRDKYIEAAAQKGYERAYFWMADFVCLYKAHECEKRHEYNEAIKWYDEAIVWKKKSIQYNKKRRFTESGKTIEDLKRDKETVKNIAKLAKKVNR